MLYNLCFTKERQKFSQEKFNAMKKERITNEKTLNQEIEIFRKKWQEKEIEVLELMNKLSHSEEARVRLKTSNIRKINGFKEALRTIKLSLAKSVSFDINKGSYKNKLEKKFSIISYYL